MRAHRLQLPPLELDWSGFDDEIVLGSPADLSVLLLKRMRSVGGEYADAKPSVSSRPRSVRVKELGMEEWEEALRVMEMQKRQ